MRIGSLFSGYGGLDMGVQAALGGTVAWHVEVDKDASAILAHHWPDVPNLGDISAVDWEQVEPVDILTGGFPCQDVSHAGKRAGIAPGTRSGLWSEFARAIQALRPGLVVIENVRGLLSARADRGDDVGDVGCPLCDVENTGQPTLRALGAVLGDLAELGYDARWAGVRAADAGAPHGRFRVFIVAHPRGGSLKGLAATGDGLPVAAERSGHAPADAAQSERRTSQPEHLAASAGRAAEPRERAGTDFGPYTAAVHRWERILGRPAPPPTEVGAKGQQRLSPRFVEWMMGLSDGHVTEVPISRNAQLKALGNGVVPQQAELALRWLLFGEWAGVDGDVVALPTPAVNDMGAGKTVEAWDEWTDRMKAQHGNGNGHGKSLAIEAARLGGDAA